MAQTKADILDELQGTLQEAADLLEEARQQLKAAKFLAVEYGGEISRVVGGQLEAYTIPWIADFTNGSRQPGSVSKLLDFTDAPDGDDAEIN